jgi:dTDP-4-amino-4,6-dideoxygalactose transaminase
LNIRRSAITTPFSFIATSSTLQWENIRPVFADIDPVTWNLDPSQIPGMVRQDTSAIVATDVFGNPCDVEGLQAVADRHGLETIYDGAHAFGVRVKGDSVANWGDISTLSFHATKVFHTVEGGAIITDDALAQRVRELSNFGFSKDNQISGPGINAKLNEFSTAMGCVLWMR